MKKALITLFTVSLVLSFASCGSNQAEIDSRFRDTYTQYQSAIIMTGATRYVVAKNDTLTRIARNQYGRDNAYYFPLILLATNLILEDPDQIEIGTELIIPNLQTNLANAGARAKIKEFLAKIAKDYQGTNKRWSEELYENLMYTSNAL